MQHNFQTWKTRLAGCMVAGVLLFACNKDLPEATPIEFPVPAGNTIMQALDGPNYTFLKAAVTRAGLTGLLSDRKAVLTVLAPTDAAFQLSGIPSVAAINAIPVANLVGLLSYHIIGGQRYESAQISDKFPNMYLQSTLVLQAPSAALPPGYRMPITLSRRGNNAWANNIPVTQANIAAANGIIHNVAALVAPPSLVIAQIAAGNTDLTYLMAAIARADSGVAAPNRLVDALSNAAANFTVFAPTNAAFQALLTGAIAQALIAQGMPPATALATAQALASTPDVFQNPALFGALPALSVRGIVAYHVIGRLSANPTNQSLIGRAFSVNMPATSTPVNTLVVPAPNIGPVPVFVQSAGANFTVKGLANATPSNVTTRDVHAVNGVVHIIDQVLLPQ